MSNPAIYLSLLACAFAADTPAHADTAAASDPVRAAFVRLHDRTPTADAPLPPAAERHRAASTPTIGEQLLAATPDDSLAASFQRMLGHQSAAGELRTANAAAADPLTAMLAASLWPARLPAAAGRP